MEEREPERASTQSTAIYEDKDGMNSATGNTHWDDVETRHQGCCNLSRMEGLEPDAATRESTASKECKDGTSRLADKVRWDATEECTDGMATSEMAEVDWNMSGMDASIHPLVKDEACLELRC